MLQIVPVDPRSVEVALDIVIDLPAVAYVGVDDGALVGSGGLAWGGGRCWVWFSVINGKPSYALKIRRWVERLKRKARQLGETEVYTIRDPQFETSARLVKLSGFTFHAMELGNEVFRCEL